MSELEQLFEGIARYAAARREGDPERLQRPVASFEEQLERCRLVVQDEGVPAEQVIGELIEKAEPGLAAMTGPRFFGWVIGASNPTGVAADWLTSTWGQNTANHRAAPSAAAVEAQAGAALLDLLHLPREASVGFVTGGTMANFTCLAAARGEVLRRAGWDVEADGLFGAPPISVLIGEEAHSTVFAALKYLGLGASRVVTVPVDRNGAIIAEAFREAAAEIHGPMIAIAQAGQINTGAFDPFVEMAEALRGKHAWLHVDGAFGLWARATKTHQHLGAGLELADSWAVDGHKWLQTPYDAGYAIVKDREAHARAMQIPASYLPGAGDGRRTLPTMCRSGAIAAGAWLCDMGADPPFRAQADCGDDLAALRVCAAVRAEAGGGAGRCDRQRCGAEPGSRAVRHGRPDARGNREIAGRRRHVRWRRGLARRMGYADFSDERNDGRGRGGSRGRRDH